MSGIEKGKNLVNTFVQVIGKQLGVSVTRTQISQNVFEMTGKFHCLLYIKARAEHPLRWGVTANVINKLRKQTKPWAVVLLYISENRGYFLPSMDVVHYAANVWALGADGDYKPSTGSYLGNNKPFQSLNEFFSQLSTFVQQPFSIDVAIEEAKKEAERILKHGGGESQAHKSLKSFVANNPSSIGLKNILSVYQEYSFPSGDKVDVAFESPNNHWSVVEIELQGLPQTLVGLFQTIKYKALQEAVMKSKDQEGSVEGLLVARSIPEQVRSLADKLSINTFEVKS